MVLNQALAILDQQSQNPITSEGSPVKVKPNDTKKAEQDAELEEHFNLIDGCPVFTPTLEEFNSKTFSQYIQECDANCGSAGIFKVKVL